MLFHEKGLLASTIARYRSALSVPLRTVLNIDVLDPAVSGMFRAMSLRRPSRPLTAPPGIYRKSLTIWRGCLLTSRPMIHLPELPF